MSFFSNLFHFDGISNGLKKGLAYDVDFAKRLASSVRTGNTEELGDLAAVAEEFVKESTDEAGNVKGNLGNLVMSAALGAGHDPFAGSRKMMQDLEAKWPRTPSAHGPDAHK